MRFRGLNVGHESREPTGFTIPFWRRANARNVIFVTLSESDDEGLTLETSSSWPDRKVTTKG